jgi:hypothetical protein
MQELQMNTHVSVVFNNLKILLAVGLIPWVIWRSLPLFYSQIGTRFVFIGRSSLLEIRKIYILIKYLNHRYQRYDTEPLSEMRGLLRKISDCGKSNKWA